MVIAMSGDSVGENTIVGLNAILGVSTGVEEEVLVGMGVMFEIGEGIVTMTTNWGVSVSFRPKIYFHIA